MNFGWVSSSQIFNLMYYRWSLREIWLQSVSSSISRLRFAEQTPRSLPIRTQCSLLKPGSQLSRKSELLHHPTGHASALCRTFEMTYVCTLPSYLGHYNLQFCGATAPGGPEPPRCRGLVSHSDTPHLVGLLWTSAQPSQRPLPNNTQRPQQTDIHGPGGGIRTHNPCTRADVDPRLSPRGYWNRLIYK